MFELAEMKASKIESCWQLKHHDNEAEKNFYSIMTANKLRTKKWYIEYHHKASPRRKA